MLFTKHTFEKQPFRKRLSQNNTCREKVQAKQTEPKTNLLGKGSNANEVDEVD